MTNDALQFGIRALMRLVIILLVVTPFLLRADTISFVLQWANNDPTVEGFLIERSTDATNFTQVANLPASQLSYQDTDLSLGVTYDYRMRAYNAGGASPYSNIIIGLTPPALTIETPADDQVFSTANLTLSGTAADATGIYTVTVNGQSAALAGTTWSTTVTLAAGTNTLLVIATDNSSKHYTTTQIVHAVFSPTASGTGDTSGAPSANGQTSQPASPTAPFAVYPSVSNPFAQMSNVTVVLMDEPLLFTVATTAPFDAPLSYAWDFGDQQTAVGPNPTHAYTETNCQSYTVSVGVSDGVDTATGTITVATACLLDVQTLQMKSNFARVNADSFTLTAAMDLNAGFTLTNEVVMVNVGNAQVAFQLDRLGKGTSVYGSCKLAYDTATGRWLLKTSLHGGNWQSFWNDDGLIDEPVTDTPVTVPVVIVVGKNAFAAETQLHYSTSAGRSGTAH